MPSAGSITISRGRRRRAATEEAGTKLAEPLDVTLAAVVQKLQVLEESGLVQTEMVGRVRTCRIEPAGLAAAEKWIRDRRTIWERRLGRLGSYWLAGQTQTGRIGAIQAERVIASDPEIISGMPCFRGARIPFKNLIDYLEWGNTLEEFLRQFPGVRRDMAIQSPEDAKDSLLAQIV